MSTEIPLVNGRGSMLVDDEDADLVAPYRWRLFRTRWTDYAAAGSWRNGTFVTAHRLVLPTPLHLRVDHRNHVGDPTAGEWTDWTGRAFHLRRRLTDREARKIGPPVDVRGTPEADRRWRAVRHLVPPGVGPL